MSCGEIRKGNTCTTSYPKVSMAGNQEAPMENVDIDVSPNKRKLRSDVWENFKKVKNDKGEQFAYCNYCKKKFTGASTSGTTHLKRHLERCPRRSQVDVGQQILTATKNAQDKSLSLKNFKFNQARSRMDLTRAILKHEYPFNMVEHEYFRIFLQNLQPSFHVVSRNTVRSDVMEIYTIEKEKLYGILDQNSSRISLTTDMWTSDQNDGYLCLTGHFLDDEWKLSKKILNFVKVSDAPNAETLFKVIKKCLLDWNVDKKISSITVDNCSTNDSMVRKLKEWIGPENLMLNGDIFHFRCNAHVLNIMVQDGMSLIKLVIVKVRDSVKYAGASPNRKLKWEAAMSQLKFKSSKGLCQDVGTRWNATYLMLESALVFKDVFMRLEQIDEDYKTAPSKEEWEMAKTICDILKHFHDASKLFSGTQYATANQYFPEAANIHLKLNEWCDDENEVVRNLALQMKPKFDKYWSTCNLGLAIAVVLDPRFKFKLVEYYYFLIYSFDSNPHMLRIREALFEVFSAYESKYGTAHVDPNYGSTSSHDVGEIQEKLLGFDNWCQGGSSSSQLKKSELELYLGEPMFPRVPKFDILGWWKANAPKYPVLSKVARDILAVPISTVASESAFSTSGRVLDPFRSSLLPDIVEALICGQDWVVSEKKVGSSTARDDFSNSGPGSSTTVASTSSAQKEKPAVTTYEIFLDPQ